MNRVELLMLLLVVNTLVGTSTIASEDKPSEFKFTPNNKYSIVESVSGYTELNQFLRMRSLGRFKRDEQPTGKKLEDVYELRNRNRLAAELMFSDTISGKISFDIELFYNLNEGDWHSENNTRLWEAYVDFDYENTNIRLGRQVIRWGKADQINLIDNFTPQDLRNLLDYKRGDRKWPVLAASFKYFFAQDYTWETIWLPYFRPNIMAGQEQDWELFVHRNYVKTIGLTEIKEERSKNSLSTGVFATKLTHAAENYDVSINYTYHFEQFPSYNVNFNPGYLLTPGLTTPGTVQREHQREKTLGMDYETQLAGFGLRGELVYTTNKPYTTLDLTNEDLIVRKRTIQLITGFDYRFKNQTYINLQLTMDHIRDFEALTVAEPNEYSLTWQLSQAFMHDLLNVEFMGRAFFHETDLFYRISLTYELTDNMQIYSGLMVFDGDDFGIFGQYKYNDQLFFNVKYNF